MSDDRKSLRTRQTVIFLLVWIGGGWFGSMFIADYWHPRYMALAWLSSAVLGAFCVWLFTGKWAD